ncbi:hypothetical protein QVD17_23162 [Tagetes erecta]|uniref:Uncharacterized protein n=1 Tax=Tagetes erecta TaxID=13708 RepID=A0AAD8KE84_TARER|nr:hypothetical protein QVD17_23162 [Tagetes erecta]
MEPDLPLIQMAEEEEDDVSLIQQLPDLDQTPSKSSLNYSSFSPFALPPSLTKSVKDGVRMEKPSGSSSGTISNKENINSDKVEVGKLGMEPMQMKKRKKGVGYNLRKSLAWDRAFFTDEGILDPHELTLITGIDANTCGGGLPTISEEGNSSFSSEVRCTNQPNDVKAYEEAPLKALRENNHTPKRNKEKTGCSMRNSDSLPHNKVTHKVLSSNYTNRRAPKIGGCSKAVAASSYPFLPASSNTLKTPKKESKLPKLPGSKAGSCSYATTKSSMTASQLRHNPIPKATINVDKSFGVKSSLQNAHRSQSKSKTGSGKLHLPVKELAQKTVNHLSHSSKAASSTNSQLVHPVQFDRANNRSEMVQDTLQLSKVQEEPTPIAAKHNAQYAAANLNSSLPEAPRLSSSGPCHIQSASKSLMLSDKLQPCESQEHPTALPRPSGLRLPSPSLRLFGQITASKSGSLQQKKSQQYMGSDRKIGEPRPPTRLPMKSNSITENAGCSSSTQLCPSPSYNTSINGGPVSNTQQNLVANIVPRIDIKVDNECRGSDQEKRILGHDPIVATWKGDEGKMASHSTKQLTGNVGTCHQLLSEGRVPEPRYKSVFCNKEDGLQSYTGQSIQHLEENISNGVDDLTQNSWEQADTKKSDDAFPKVNPESHLDAGSQVIVESQKKDDIRKREDDIGTTKCVTPDIESYSVPGQEKDVSKVVDDKRLPNGITENLSCVVSTSTKGCCAPSTQLSPSPNYMFNTVTKGVPDSNAHQNLVAKTAPRVDIKLEYECRGSEQEKICEDEEIVATWKGDEGIKASHPTKQLDGNVGTYCQLMSEDRVAETKYKSVLCNKEDGLQSYTAFSMSTSGQAIQHEEKNIGVWVDDLVQTSREQTDVEKPDDAPPKVNPESHLDAGSQVFVESQEQDEIRKREDDVGTSKCVAPGIESYSDVLRKGLEIDVSKVVDDRSLPMEEDGIPCSRKVSMTFGDSHSLEDVIDAIELKGVDTSCILFQSLSTEQGNDDADGVDAFSTTTSPHVRDPFAEEGNSICINPATSVNCEAQLHDSPVRDTVTQLNDNPSAEGSHIEPPTSIQNKYQIPVTLLLHDNPSSTEGFHSIPTTSTKNKSQLLDTGTANGSPKCFMATTPSVSALQNFQLSVSCTMPAESSCLEESMLPYVTDTNDHFSQEKSVSSAMLMEVPGQKQDGDVDLIPREVAPLIDDQNQSGVLSRLELISETASLGDDTLVKMEPLVQGAQCTSTYPQSLERERLEIAASTVEAHLKIARENHNNQEMGIAFVAENSQDSCGNILEAEPALQESTGGSETCSQFQNENQTLEGSGCITSIFKTNLEDVQVRLSDDALVQSCGRLTSDTHNHFIESADHCDILRNQAGFSDSWIKLERASRSNEYFQQEAVCRAAWNVVEGDDVYESDPSNTIIADTAPTVAEEVDNNDGQLCVECRTSGFTVIDSIAEHNEKYTDGQSAKHGDLMLNHDSELEPPVEDKMFVKNSMCMEYCSAGEESCLFSTHSMTEEKRTLFLDDQVLMEDSLLSTEKIVDSVVAPEENPNSSTQILPMLSVNGDDQPQGFIGNIASVETYNYFSDGQSNSSFSLSQQLTTDVKTTSTPEICSLVDGTEGSKISIGDESCSLATHCMLEEKTTLFFDDQVLIEDSLLSTEKIVDSVVAPKENTNGSTQILPMLSVNGDDQPQGFVGSMPSVETYDYITDGQSSSSFSLSQQLTTDVKTTSTPEICSLVGGVAESLLTKTTYFNGAEGSKISIAEQDDTHPMVDEFHHELDDLKDHKDVTMLIKKSNSIKREDNSLVIHPPNAVPFSDEWLAAFEAAGEEILTMKCGAVQHSPQDKSLPEPSPWSPVKKANQIGPYDCTKYTNAMQSNSQVSEQ